MTPWQRLAEARIREWQQKPAAERDSRATPDEPFAPLERQLLEEIIRLYHLAAAADRPGEAAALRRQAADHETHLMIILESSGRPLAAQHFSRLLQEIRRETAER
jgi:hypothetical protein